MPEVTLIDIIKTWLDNEHKYTKHFRIVSNLQNTPLTWIACECRGDGEIPPTPMYDILILPTYIDAWHRQTRVETKVLASDPSFFEQLSVFLDNCHEDT